MQLLEKLKKFAQRQNCRHKYDLRALTDQYAVYQCRNCGKEIQLNGENVPDMLLRWGYGWYHGDAGEEEMRLLKEQGIAKNNTVIVPERIVYIVSYFEKMEESVNRNGRPGGVNLGDICTKGIYFTHSQASTALNGPIASCFCEDYPFASIECYESGLANPESPIQFFRYDTQTCAYQEIEAPIYIRRKVKTIAMGFA